MVAKAFLTSGRTWPRLCQGFHTPGTSLAYWFHTPGTSLGHWFHTPGTA